MKLLEGKKAVDKIEKRLKQQDGKKIMIFSLNAPSSSMAYINRIKKNTSKYNIDFELFDAKTEEEFINKFYESKKEEVVTSIMFIEPLTEKLRTLIDEIPPEKDVEGITKINAGKLILGDKTALIPCTSKAVIEIIDAYKIDLCGKNVVIIGRSNIVGKPLIPQLLEKNATVTICHSKTKDIKKITKKADVIIVAIGKANFLTKEYVKKQSIIIDVGINFKDGKMVGDANFEDLKDYVKAITPVPGGIGPITNILMIENILKPF